MRGGSDRLGVCILHILTCPGKKSTSFPLRARKHFSVLRKRPISLMLPKYVKHYELISDGDQRTASQIRVRREFRIFPRSHFPTFRYFPMWGRIQFSRFRHLCMWERPSTKGSFRQFPCGKEPLSCIFDMSPCQRKRLPLSFIFSLLFNII